jgi:hypothetical protein
MPVVLRMPEERNAWMAAPAAEALELRRPLPERTLRIVAKGTKTDESAQSALPNLFSTLSRSERRRLSFSAVLTFECPMSDDSLHPSDKVSDALSDRASVHRKESAPKRRCKGEGDC